MSSKAEVARLDVDVSHVPIAPEFGKRLVFVDSILAKRGYQASELIGVLQEIQEAYHYLPEDLLTYVSVALRIKQATVFGVATFYAQFSLEPKGKYEIRICDGTACHVRNSNAVRSAVRKRLKLPDGKFTTADQLFTVETVRCLGACSIAPAMVINGQVHPRLTPEAATTIVDTLLAREAGLHAEARNGSNGPNGSNGSNGTNGAAEVTT